jgi:hypothetical protein
VEIVSGEAGPAAVLLAGRSQRALTSLLTLNITLKTIRAVSNWHLRSTTSNPWSFVEVTSSIVLNWPALRFISFQTCLICLGVRFRLRLLSNVPATSANFSWISI